MISISRIGSAMQKFFEATAKARVNSVLLGMDRDRLAEWGYSYELLKLGPKAWPWRETNQDGAQQTDETNRPGAAPSACLEPAQTAEKTALRESHAADPHAPDFDTSRDAA